MAQPLRCPRCGRDNDPSFSFCLDCGQSLKVPQERSCPGCGTAMPAGFRFCGRCGRPVEGAPPAAASAGRGGPPAPAPSAASRPSSPRLVVLRQDGAPGAVHALSREVTVCGRREGEVRLAADGSVSARHAAVTLRGGRGWLEDLGSTSGTFLRLRASRALVPGDEIRVGRQLLRLESMAAPAPRADAPRPWGSPDPGYRARLVQVLEGGDAGEAYPLPVGTSSLGRESGDVTFPGDRYVSARHARIDVGEKSVTLTDLNSSNGTFVRITVPAELSPGDQILLGMQLLRYEA